MARRLNASLVEDLLLEMQSRKGSLELDLRKLDTIERAAGAILSNALVGSLGARPLKVFLGGANRDWMTTSGLAFAVANRSGDTAVVSESGQPPWAEWRRDWRPGQIEPLKAMMATPAEELFAPEQLGETAVMPDRFASSFAAFINPHLTQPELQRHPLTTLLWPWLDRLLPSSQKHSIDREARAAWVADVGSVIDEVLCNICEHARWNDGRRVLSLVQVSATRGGGRRSSNRVHLCVQDNGPGIPATARPKISFVKLSGMSEQQIVACLLEGTLSPWGRARGQGLPRVVDICRRLEGTLRVATKTTRAVVDAHSSNHAVHTSQAGFRLDGTVVTLTLPVPGS
jgi:hypothetical protein